MLNIYPANKLENLSLLLNKVLALETNNILTPDLIITQSQGMRHWINMQLAEQNGVSMNVEFLLPMQFLWKQIRNVVGHENVPEKTSYSREVICWRIYQLLATDEYIEDPIFEEPTQYWIKDGEKNQLKRYQLAVQLADLFEQYLIYRPDWITSWESGEIEESHQWQAKLWLALVSEDSLHVVSLIQQVTPLLSTPRHKMPQRVCIFGINVLPPIWLDFLSELSEHIEIHLFHLNPCCEYWGDLQSEKQLAKWLALGESDEGFSGDLGNPLLANLGAQGREFLSMLPERSVNEIPFFQAPENVSSDQVKQSVLRSLQQDILELRDARDDFISGDAPVIDDSIIFTSAHSILREVQGLHDYLLHQFNNDPDLAPKDIIVMCPQIENYAQYIEAVFTKVWHAQGHESPKLPYSIADRTLKNVEPIIDIFEQLLLLPDSRFQLSEIMSYLRLPAIALKFDIKESDILVIEKWLQAACVHWGINKAHKKNVISNEHTPSDFDISEQFTWKQGLERLLLGFAYGDQERLYDGKLLLPTVEGDESHLLGKLMLLLEQLSEHANSLKQERTAEQWHEYLTQVKASLFEELEENLNGSQTLSEAIDSLAEYTEAGSMFDLIGLNVVRDFLSNHFNQAESSKQFMAGQITFCSMIPMRSVPFKHVCILGLNDGDFPRFDVPLSFDLIAKGKGRKGDRSRRSDDRYLFLEALISARDKLYLSYQGHQIKDNGERQPSLILRELMEYLENGYGWCIDSVIHQLPLQAFSFKNYQGAYPSFDPNWLRLCQNNESRENIIELPAQEAIGETLTLHTLVQFFEKPLETFARQRLALYFPNEGDAYEDAEPFESNNLDKYKLRHEYLETSLDENESDVVTQKALLSGRLPDNSITVSQLREWSGHAEEFAVEISSLTPVSKRIENIEIAGHQLSGEIRLSDDQSKQVEYRLTVPKSKDYISLWIKHLFAHLVTGQGVTTTGCYFNEKNKRERIKQVVFNAVSNDFAIRELTKLISVYKEGLKTPLFIPASLAINVFTKLDKSKQQIPMQQHTFELLWTDSNNGKCYFDDPYVRFFFNDVPDYAKEIQTNIYDVYFALFSHLNPNLLSLSTGTFIDQGYSGFTNTEGAS